MMGDSALFDRLVAEALALPFEGWNFSYIADRWREAPTSWDYRAKARALMAGASSLLDMDTGGGEVLASLAPFPPLACATEGWDPNVPVARVWNRLGYGLNELTPNLTCLFLMRCLTWY